MKRHQIEGYEPYLKFMKEFDCRNKKIYILFSGSNLPTGESWCDDCVRAKPLIQKFVDKDDHENSHFIEVKVGDRPTWKDMNCPFRSDKTVHLRVLPTLLRWNTVMRLEGDQCENLDLLELLFTEE